MAKEKIKKTDDALFPAGDKGGVYLVVVDDSPEFDAALRRVAKLAKKNQAHAALLYVIEEEGFLHWNFIEKQIRKDQRQEAEKALWEAAQRLYDLSGRISGFYIKEGKTFRGVSQILNTDPMIRALVLGASSVSSNPLISYFTGKGLSELRVPLLIVPEDLETSVE
ncbi:MAG: universal stress protein [Rhodospirillales bacterium]|nr:universal stress protein [Rhodospirillales bacterium]